MNEYFLGETDYGDSEKKLFDFHEFAYVLLMFGVILLLQEIVVLNAVQEFVGKLEEMFFVSPIFIGILCLLGGGIILFKNIKR